MLTAISLVLTTIPFTNITAELKIQLANDAACWVDVDADGWTDLVCGGVVWRSEQGKSFERLTEGLGSVVAADYDNDGYPDLFSYSRQKLYRNLKGKKFEAVQLPDLPATVSRGACWADLDADAFVDLFVGGFEDWERQITYPSFILKNQSGKSFQLVWQESKYRTRGVTACDFDRDGLAEVYVSNYRLQPNQLWNRSKAGVMRDLAPDRNAVATSEGFSGGHSIGAAWGDFDGDGEIDLFAGNFAHVDDRGDQPKSRFLHNKGAKGGCRFDDKGTCGVWYQESYASPAAGDADNDGDLDLFFTTVYGTASFNRPNYPVLFQNEGAFKFTDATEGSGLEKLPPTYQAAFADLRNDGRLCLATAGSLFASKSPAKHWLGVRLEGDGKKVNRSAIGAQVRIKVGSRVVTRQVEAGTGEGNQNDLRLHVGLGDNVGPVDLDILWPGGFRQTVKSVRSNRIVTVKFRR
ncbi:MAG: hypothetical protein HONBIEJF_01435 [Fimbriimonadaceae bacterium]|nr:hypothetical protein [Fimbriimonadaceae bacterium]